MSKKSKIIIGVSSAVACLVVIAGVFILLISAQSANAVNSKRGTLDVQLSIKPVEGKAVTDSMYDSAKIILERRLARLGLSGSEIAYEKEANILKMQIPLKQEQTEEDITELVQMASKTSYVTFQEVDEEKKDDKGNYSATGKIIVDSLDIKNAKAEKGDDGETLLISFTNEGTKKFAEATARLIGKPIAVFFDELMIFDPYVEEEIKDGKVTVNVENCDYTASELAELIMSGRLPFKLELVK